jgi:hypothetical protein
VTAAMPVMAEAVRPVNVAQAGSGRGAGPSGEGRAATDPAGSGSTVRGTSLVERGYVHARFGGVPVLVGPELAAQLKTIRRTQPAPEHGRQP